MLTSTSLRLRALAGCLLVFAAFLTAIPTIRAQPIDSNLILNGDFEAFTDWTLLDAPLWGDAFYDIDSNCNSSNTTGCLKASVTAIASGGEGRVSNAWQCVEVEPNRAYGMGLQVYGFGNPSDSPARLILVDRTGESCPGATEPPASGDAFASVFLPDPGTWNTASGMGIVPPGVTRIAAALHTGTGSSTDEARFFFDEVVLGEFRPDVGVQMAVSDDVLVPLEEFTIDVTFSSEYNGIQPDLRIHYQDEDWLDLVDYDCEVGDVVDASQGGFHFFQWFNIPDDPEPYEHSCTITAQANGNVSGTFFLSALATSEGADYNPSNDQVTIEMEVTEAPDVAATIGVSELPEAGDTVDIDVSFTNVGTGPTGSNTDVSVALSVPLPLQSTTGDAGCTSFSETSPGTVETSLFVPQSPDTKDCTLTFQIPDEQPQAGLGAQVFTNTVGDFNSSNDSDDDATRIVHLLVNQALDGFDGSFGDGICEETADAGDCSLRAAVMEANALQATTGRTFTIELPFSPFDYTLTRTTGGDAEFHGSLDITRRMNLVGVPDAEGNLPFITAGFPSADADRLIRIGNPAGFVRIENVHLRGQNLVPTDTDGLGTDGGLILHQSGELVVRNVTLANGATDGRGGAIYSTSDDANGHLTLERVKVFDNEADDGGGLAFVPESIAILTIEESELYGNEAGDLGGGVFAAGVGGGLPNVQIRRSTVHDNVAMHGAGVQVSNLTFGVFVRNSTVSGNEALQTGGGIAATSNSVLGVYNSTIAFNDAAPGDDDNGLGGGIYQSTGATATLYNSLVSSNTGYLACSQPNPPLPPICVPRAANCYGTVDSDGYNAMAPDAECTFSSTATDDNTNVQLAALADNGGPTPTHAPGSAAWIVDVGDPACLESPSGNSLTVDQRGALRWADGDDDGSEQCDRGAVEVRAVVHPAHPVAGWRMLSVPGEGLTVDDLEDMNLVQGAGGAYPNADPNLFVGYEGPLNQNYTAAPDTAYALTPGKGFFWYLFNDADFSGTPPPEFVDIDDFTLPREVGIPLEESASVAFSAIPATEGNDLPAYMIGNPFRDAFRLQGVSVDDGTMQTNVHAWDPWTQSYTAISCCIQYMSPWQGFWVEVDGGTQPPIFTLDVEEVDGSENPPIIGLHSDESFALDLKLRGTLDGGREVADLANRIRFESDAKLAWDRHDGSKFYPPISTDGYALLSPEGIRNGQPYRQSVRSLPGVLDKTATIPIAFLSDEAGSFEISAMPEGLPEDWSLTLRDLETEEETNLLEEDYAFTGAAGEGWQDRFELIVMPAGVVGTEDDPIEFRLSKVFPNPATTSAALVLRVPEAQRATARVYDTLGRRIATVHDGALGAGAEARLEIDTSALAAGAYVVRVEGEHFAGTRRFTVVR